MRMGQLDVRCQSRKAERDARRRRRVSSRLPHRQGGAHRDANDDAGRCVARRANPRRAPALIRGGVSSTSPSQGDSTTSAVERLAFQHAVHALIRTTSVSGFARSTNWETHQLQMLRTTDAYDYFPIIKIVNLRHAERRGETLRDRLNTARKLPVDEAVRL